MRTNFFLQLILTYYRADMRQQQGLDGSYGLMLSLTQSDRRNSLVHAEAFLARLTRRQHVRLAKKGVMETLTNDENRRPNYGIHTNTDLSHAQLVENELTSTNLLKNDSFLNEYQVSYAYYFVFYMTNSNIRVDVEDLLTLSSGLAQVHSFSGTSKPHQRRELPRGDIGC